MIIGLIVLWIVLFVLKHLNVKALKYICTPLITLCAFGMAVIAIHDTGFTSTSLWIICGLAMAMVADAMLMIDEVDLMQVGIVFFILTHIFYIVGMVSHFQVSFFSVLFVIVLASVFYVMYRLLKNISIFIPVMVYMTILLSMVFIAWSSYSWLLFAGSTLFLISDMLLALNAFVKPFKNAGLYVWLTYAPAQMCFALSCFYM